MAKKGYRQCRDAGVQMISALYCRRCLLAEGVMRMHSSGVS